MAGQRVIRSFGPDNIVKKDGPTKEEMLIASWDYWERRGLEHPMKKNNGIMPMKTRKIEDLLNE